VRFGQPRRSDLASDGPIALGLDPAASRRGRRRALPTRPLEQLGSVHTRTRGFRDRVAHSSPHSGAPSRPCHDRVRSNLGSPRQVSAMATVPRDPVPCCNPRRHRAGLTVPGRVEYTPNAAFVIVMPDSAHHPGRIRSARNSRAICAIEWSCIRCRDPPWYGSPRDAECPWVVRPRCRARPGRVQAAGEAAVEVEVATSSMPVPRIARPRGRRGHGR